MASALRCTLLNAPFFNFYPTVEDVICSKRNLFCPSCFKNVTFAILHSVPKIVALITVRANTGVRALTWATIFGTLCTTVFFNLLRFTAPFRALKNLAAPQHAKNGLFEVP